MDPPDPFTPTSVNTWHDTVGTIPLYTVHQVKQVGASRIPNLYINPDIPSPITYEISYG